MTPAPTPLDGARAAARDLDWARAYDGFRSVDAGALSPADLEAMADAAWWCTRLDESLMIRQRAYAAHAAAGDDRRAGYAAWFLHADYLLFKGNASVASGWLQRAERHLASESGSVEHAFLELTRADALMGRGELRQAAALTDEVLARGRRLRSEDLVTMALETLGRIRIADGDEGAGVALLDEAMCAVLAGGVHPLFTGWVYCSVLGVCFRLGDLKRAAEWSAAAASWCASLTVTTPYHGLCRAYRVEVLAQLGDLAAAEAEGRRASEELAALEPRLAAETACALGEIRRRLGDLTGAEAAFREAHALGRDPMPGLALVWLAQGRASEAATALAAATPGGTPLAAARLLAARVEVALATDDAEGARGAVDRLRALAAGAPGSVLQATSWAAEAALWLHGSELERARDGAGRAVARWQELRMPYEAAAAMLLRGRALERLGLAELARLDFEAARAGFERLGAALDARRASDLLSPSAPTRPAALTPRELQVLRLVARGRTNRQIAGELGLSGHTISRHLQNIFVKLGVSSRAAATGLAYQRGLLPVE